MNLLNLFKVTSFWHSINLFRFGFDAIITLTILLLLHILWTLIMYFYGQKVSEKALLELTFPADNHKSAFATEQLYILLHTQAKQRTVTERLLSYKKTFSLELVSSAKEGIRYIIAIPAKDQAIIHRSLLSYLPGIKVRKIEEYIPENNATENKQLITELKLSGDFVLPLRDQKTLGEYDPMAYLTGHMTKLSKDELISFQIVFTPILASTHRSIIKRIKYIRNLIYYHANLSDAVSSKPNPGLMIGKTILGILETIVKLIISIPALLFDYRSNNIPIFQSDKIHTKGSNPYEEELAETIKSKISQNLFETSLRIMVIGESKDEVAKRASELIAAFRPLANSSQSLDARDLKLIINSTKNTTNFTQRKLSSGIFTQNPILSTSELADIYHFPHTGTTQTEGLIKSKSQELPTPLSLKNNNSLDVVFGHNTYGNGEVEIGLTDDERSRHMYIIGQTGSGKSTIIYHMAIGDMAKGRGLAVIDPHGDLSEDLLLAMPDYRKDDLIYFNPFDIQHPIGINLLELSEGLTDDELELEKELVCESVISIFRRIFNKDETVDAHRIEYVLRNTIYTAFTVKDATIFTVYELLNDPDFQKQTIRSLTNKNLKSFWKNEFGKAGDYQVVKMVSGVTAKIGRFLFSPVASRILEQPKSTINFDDILDHNKILLCNLAEGKIGEDTSQLLGTMIIAKIQQAALRRARKETSSRRPFYLFVDEFQNFATSSFTKLLSGGRKFGLRVTIAEQSTAQQKDRNIVDVILANVGINICFRTASPVDEQLMLPLFAPQVKTGDIANLPRFHFFMRLAAIDTEDPFSGVTLPINRLKDPDKVKLLVETSQNNYATLYEKPEPEKAPVAIRKKEIFLSD